MKRPTLVEAGKTSNNLCLNHAQNYGALYRARGSSPFPAFYLPASRHGPLVNHFHLFDRLHLERDRTVKIFHAEKSHPVARLPLDDHQQGGVSTPVSSMQMSGSIAGMFVEVD
jgi:hypothetical protein